MADARTARDELDHVRESVSAGSSAKADFLANISHELRTPVTVAKGIAYVLRNPAVAEDERTEFLEQLQASLDKLMGIVDEIITMAELERGTFQLEIADVDLAPLVRHAIDEVGDALPRRPDRRADRRPPVRPSPTAPASAPSCASSSTTPAATRPPSAASRCAPACWTRASS